MSDSDPWMPIAPAAGLLGVSEVWLRQWTHGKCGPVLPSREISGKAHVRAGEAYEHIRRHAKRVPPGLRKPAVLNAVISAETTGNGGVSSNDHTLDPDIRRVLGDVDPLTIDPHELAWKLLVGGIAPEKIKTAVAVANAHQRKRDSAARAGKNFAPDDVTRMLRAHGELLVEEIDCAAPRAAAGLLRVVRESLGVDLAAKNPSAARILEAAVREELGNATIAAVRRRVEEQVREIQVLEFQV